ncbi:RNA polymerase sigma factor [Flexivirga alba]|uniref:RNA polymerase sigma factor n=1 Tax=Flexivirga alba TaxID=702742 RepID=A0ABW2AE60_9MICO
MTDGSVDQAITRAHHEEWARVVAGLTRRFGDLDIAEESAAEAFVAAVERWPRDGIPPNPGGWLTTTATRKAIDRLRRESRRGAKHEEAQLMIDETPSAPTGPVEDDRLRLVFTCCHPALAMEARVALTLRMLGGLTVAEIAAAFLVQETTMAQRITRAKAKIKAAHIPYRVPSAADIQERLAGVLAVVYLVFNEGYLATGGDDPVRADLTDEAIRLGRLLRVLQPENGEVAGLLALMLLTDARRAARVSRTGELVTLDEQDRGAWDRELIAEGHALVRERLAVVAAGGEPRAVTNCWPRSTRCTPTRQPHATRTGRRSSPSTTVWRSSIPHPSYASTGPWRSPKWTGLTLHWARSIGSPNPSTVTTHSTPHARICCGGSAGVATRERHTTGRSNLPATPRSARTSLAAETSWSTGSTEPVAFPALQLRTSRRSASAAATAPTPTRSRQPGT